MSNAEVREACGMNNAGTNMVGLYRAASALGLQVELKPLDLYDLRDNAALYLPAIVAVKTAGEQLHFITIHRFGKAGVTVMDPAVGLAELPFDELWSRIERQQLAIAKDKVTAEQEDAENRTEALSRLSALGIPEIEGRQCLENHGLFLIDDCLKYVELMQKADRKRGFGGAAELMRNLLGDSPHRLPSAFDSDIRPLEGQSLSRMRSPLVLVCHGPAGKPDRRRSSEPRPRLRLFRFLMKHLNVWITFAVMAVAMSLLGILFPLASGWVIDSLDLGWPPLLYVLVAVALTRLFHQFVTYAYTVGVGRLQMAITTRLKAGLLLQFQDLPEWMMKDRMPGELMTRLEESRNLSLFITTWGLGVLTASLSLALAVMLMIRLWWPVLLLSVGAMGAGYAINEIFARRLRLLSRDVLESSAQFHSRLMEMFRGLETIRLVEAGTGAFFSSDSKLASKIRATYRQQDWSLITQSAMGTVEAAVTVGIGVLAYWGLSRGTETPGTIITSITLSTMARGSLSALLGYRKQVEHQAVVLERSEEFLENPTAARPDDERPLPAGKSDGRGQSFVMENVSFAYDERRPVLKHLNLELDPGRSVCLLGDSGAGKSTLMDLMCGMIEPTAGRILIDGVEAGGDARRAWGVHRIEQEPVLIAGTILENVLFGLPNPGIEELVRAGEAAGFMPVVESDARGWNRLVGGRRRGLSGGEERRLCLARGLMRRPRILLLDETLSAVDWRMRHDILNGLLRDRPDRSLLLATHDASDAFMCDSVVILEDGSIAESGSPDRLQHDPESRFHRLLVLGGFAA